jgi:hypothetical protein
VTFFTHDARAERRAQRRASRRRGSTTAPPTAPNVRPGRDDPARRDTVGRRRRLNIATRKDCYLAWRSGAKVCTLCTLCLVGSPISCLRTDDRLAELALAPAERTAHWHDRQGMPAIREPRQSTKTGRGVAPDKNKVTVPSFCFPCVSQPRSDGSHWAERRPAEKKRGRCRPRFSAGGRSRAGQSGRACGRHATWSNLPCSRPQPSKPGRVSRLNRSHLSWSGVHSATIR